VRLNFASKIIKYQKYQQINDGMISQLSDKSYFKTVQLESYGTLQWDNGVDFDPDNLYKLSQIVMQPT
jgi:hypothetical protein